MNVLLLNASPKSNGATQEILNILQSQLPRGVTSELICLGELCIHYCVGDKACYRTCDCILQDDMTALLDKMNAADAQVIAAPSYWGDVPAPFKAFIDRCTAYANTNPNPAHKRLTGPRRCYAIALRAGTHTAECEHIIAAIAHWCGHMEIPIADSMYFCSIDSKADLEKVRERIMQKAAEWFGRAAQPNSCAVGPFHGKDAQ
ncbi:MAG: NAD(P)H-dependent oxidoreductase [Eubacteriales bacterium]|nr:NAD(P)H-dependent oxidoreductase [Eubacteriales bacterium]